jgi:Domain of unknown function (DUF4440)
MLRVVLLMLVAPVQLCLAQSPAIADPRLSALMAFERDLETAAARGDTAFVGRALAGDFHFTHGDAWRTGAPPKGVDTRPSWMARVAARPFVSRTVSAQQVEPHGDVVMTTGRIDVRLKPPNLNDGQAAYSIWYLRLYRAKGAGWELVSHRTVAEIIG